MFAWVKQCRCSIYADLIEHPIAGAAIALTGGAQVLASHFGFGIPCAFHQATGIPCPGCGLTRSVMALLRGDVSASIAFHPLGPLLLTGMAVALVAAVLPAPTRQKLVASIARFERKTAFVTAVAVLMMAIWGLRIAGLLPGLARI